LKASFAIDLETEVSKLGQYIVVEEKASYNNDNNNGNDNGNDKW
jgi:hypothetical protein